MKKLILLVAVGFTAITANAQKMKDAEVPALVKASFTKQYPDTKVAKWEKENGLFEAEFTSNKTEMSVLINGNGTIMETETEINPNQLPESTSRTIATNYPGKKVKEASKIVDSKGKITYEAEIDNMDVLFDADGKFVKEEKKTADTDKD